jgi:hypothetical protein
MGKQEENRKKTGKGQKNGAEPDTPLGGRPL